MMRVDTRRHSTHMTAILLAILLGIAGALLVGGGQAEAAYNSKLTSCDGRTCYSNTYTLLQSDAYWARGRSRTSISIAEFFAWTRGTNHNHVGEIFEEHACQVNNGTNCYTAYSLLCSTDPIGMGGCGTGPDNVNYWFATTWSWYKPSSTEFALFTGTRTGTDLAYCWNSMACL